LKKSGTDPREDVAYDTQFGVIGDKNGGKGRKRDERVA